MELFLIDAIGPFFRGVEAKRVNWSKVPFEHLAYEGEARRVQFDAIGADMQTFAARVSAGVDVRDIFRSCLHLKTPAMVSRMLRALLPVFERHGRRLILRTWTVGAYRVGDFMWHRGTFDRALKDIDSPALVLSMKYGESDFFRYLPLNRNFFRTRIPKRLELQSRREYEGCGEYPSFIGWDYEHYAEALEQAPNMLGISVWCQTGGWTPFKRRAYIDDSAVWNELNTFVTLRIFKERVIKRLRKAKKKYKQQYPKDMRQRYAIQIDFASFSLRGRYIRWFFAVVLRRRRGYRLVDYLLTMHLLAFGYRLLSRARPRLIPKFARKSAMGIDIVFR